MIDSLGDVGRFLVMVVGGLGLIVGIRESWYHSRHWRACLWNWLCGRGWNAL